MKYFMFCGKLSNIIAQMFGYPRKAHTKLGGSGINCLLPFLFERMELLVTNCF